MSKKTLYLSGLLWLLLGTACGGPTAVPTYTLRLRDLDYRILASFTVKDPAPLTMVAGDGGTVKAILVKEGDKVKAGQELVTLDDFTAKQNLAIAGSELENVRLKKQNAGQELLPQLKEQAAEQQKNLENAQADLNRSEILLHQGAIARVELEQAQTKYAKALSEYNQTRYTLDSFSQSGVGAKLKAELEEKTAKFALAQKTLTDKHLTAPYDAVVSSIPAQLGAKVPSNAPMIVVIADHVPTLELDIDQKELPFLAPNLPAVVKFDAQPEVKIQAHVVYVCTDINTDKGTCRLRLLLDQKNDFVKFGMSGTAEITAAEYRQVMAVPAKFVERKPEGATVWVWDGHRALRLPAEAKSVGERWAILSRLPAGTKLLAPEKALPVGKIKPGKEEDIQP
ncbi:MAG: HlyD family efflux transporter periplasmic adaptor subunit [Candidatus Firestonebacteria bacterium]|nr:HlyD family efflux transporter periplasmic adaptor subunit [Candidatus Firestonebacteria bacterium]